MSGADAASLKADERFEGWGGEDKELFDRVVADNATKVTQDLEPGLIHKWHPKYCEIGKTTPAKSFDAW